eukprot:gene25960-biopygen12299
MSSGILLNGSGEPNGIGNGIANENGHGADSSAASSATSTVSRKSYPWAQCPCSDELLSQGGCLRLRSSWNLHQAAPIPVRFQSRTPPSRHELRANWHCYDEVDVNE